MKQKKVKSEKPSKEKRLVNKETGRTLTLTENIKVSILAGISEGKSYREIADTLQVPFGNIMYWRNNVFKQEAITCELEYQLLQAEAFTDKLMKLDAGKKDSSLLAIQQKESEFRRKYQLNAKSKYNDAPTIAIQVNLPQPIVDLGHLSSEKAL